MRQDVVSYCNIGIISWYICIQASQPRFELCTRGIRIENRQCYVITLSIIPSDTDSLFSLRHLYSVYTDLYSLKI
jgi:hypothetical protein